MISKILIAIEDAHWMDVTEEFIERLQPAGSVVLRVLHVAEPDEAIESTPSEECRQEAADLVESTCKRLSKRFPQLNVEGCVKVGAAKQEIVDEASSWGSDLIVMGPYGKIGADKLLLGSVAQSVLPNSPCSVVLLRAQKTVNNIPSTPLFAQPAAGS